MSMKVLKSKIKFPEGPSGSHHKSTHRLLGPYSQTLAKKVSPWSEPPSLDLTNKITIPSANLSIN